VTPAIAALLPICALVAIGWGAAVAGVLDRQVGIAFGHYAIRIGIPVLVFHAVMASDFSVISPWVLWACYFPAAALSWALGHLLILKVLRRDERTSVIAGVGSAFANTAFVGLPLARAVYGEHGVIIVTILISIHMPVMMTAATLLMERAQRRMDGHAETSAPALAGQLLRNLATNPIIIALLLAVAFRLSGLPLPDFVNQQVAVLAEIAGPLALISIGIGLRDRGLTGDVGPAVVVTFIKLLVMPALVLVACLFAGLDAATTGPLVLLAGVPAGVNVHLVAVQFRAGQALGAGVVLLTTVASAFTSAAWLTWLAHA